MKVVSAILLAALTGCASVQLISKAEATAFKEKVLWSFGKGADGLNPNGNLIYVGGTLYGATFRGGGTGCGGYGCGTVFSFEKSTGAEKVLYSFCGQIDCVDGEFPFVGVIDVKGVLYGTTELGGATANGGTVFSLDLNTGREAVVYSFCGQQNCADGAQPIASLIHVKGMLIGEAEYGGDSGYGTVFSLDPNTGAETVLHSFGTGTDGENPYPALIDVNGTLYGTTAGGGGSDNCQPFGCGTIFSLNPDTGTEAILYSFMGGADGESPQASLIAVNGFLYGTTFAGGAHNYGTVFSLDLNTGTKKVLYSFCNQENCADGQYPEARLIDVEGKLYGTTTGGGANGPGTVFAIDHKTGTEKVVYSFCSQQNCADGAYPNASLIEVKGKLYGTASQGGAHGFGTLFVLNKER